MCGIVYVSRKDGKRAGKMTFKRYKRQQARGTDGFGFVGFGKDKIDIVTRTENEDGISKKLDKNNSDTILFHHRLPTSTPNLAEMAHPIKVENKKLKYIYYVVHNGIISNDDELKKKHNKMGFSYTTAMVRKLKIFTQKNKTIEREDFFNDSESFAIDLALYLEGKQKNLKSEGSIAFIALKTTKKGKPLNLYYGRNSGNPLRIESDKTFFCLRSEGSGYLIMPDVLYNYNYKTEETDQLSVDIGDYSFSYSSGYYPSGYGESGCRLGFKTDQSHTYNNYDQDIIQHNDYADDLARHGMNGNDELEAKNDVIIANYNERLRLKDEIEDMRIDLECLQGDYMDAQKENDGVAMTALREDLQHKKGRVVDLKSELQDLAYESF